MTEISQLELLYSQLDNLNKEIDNFLNDEEYDFALEKIKEKDTLIKNIAMASKTVEMSAEQKEIFNNKNREISKKNFELIEKLKLQQQELTDERKAAQQKLKLQNAYSVDASKKNSVFYDNEE